MKNKDLIKRLQLLDPEFEVLAQAPDGGEPCAIAHVTVDEWDNDGDGTPPTPIILLAIIC